MKSIKYVQSQNIVLFHWTYGSLLWALCYVAFCLAIQYRSSVSSFLGLKRFITSLVFSLFFNVCTLHVIYGAWKSTTLHKSDFRSDLVFSPGTSWSVATSPMSRCRTSWRTSCTRTEKMLTSKWFSSTGDSSLASSHVVSATGLDASEMHSVSNPSLIALAKITGSHFMPSYSTTNFRLSKSLGIINVKAIYSA